MKAFAGLLSTGSKRFAAACCVAMWFLPVAAQESNGWNGYGQGSASPDAAPGDAAAATRSPATTHPSAPARAADATASALAEAESFYREARWAAAMDAFRGIVAADPENARAWFRIGNLHQRRRQFTQAAGAYRRAANQAERASGQSERAGRDAGLRARALINLAAVNLELAEAALAEYDREAAALAPSQATARVDAARESIGRDALIVHRRLAAKRGGAALDGTSTSTLPGTSAGVALGASGGNPPGPAVEYLKGAP